MSKMNCNTENGEIGMTIIIRCIIAEHGKDIRDGTVGMACARLSNQYPIYVKKLVNYNKNVCEAVKIPLSSLMAPFKCNCFPKLSEIHFVFRK